MSAAPSRTNAVAPVHHWGSDVGVVLRAVVPHPSLWWESVAALARMARRGWWHHRPFLPVPDDAYWRFRMVTAFGGTGDGAALSAPDVVAYLQWCRRARPRRG